MPVELKVPKVGESIVEVEIGEWLKAEGDSVKEDEPVVMLDSEKTTVELPSPIAGTMGKILKKQGETAAIGEVIGYVEAVGAEAKNGAAPAKTPAQAAPAKAKTQAATSTHAGSANKPGEPKPEWEKGDVSPPTAQISSQAKAPETIEQVEQETLAAEKQAPPEGKEPLVMPAARRVLEEKGLRAEEVPSSGPGGRLLKEDVQRFVENRAAPATQAAPQAAPQPAQTPEPVAAATPAVEAPANEPASSGEEVVPMTLLRRRVAERLVEAQQTAALLTTFNEVDMSAIMDLRKHYQEGFQKRYNIKLGFMSFFVKATIDALKQFPAVNAEIRGRDIVYHNYYDIGVAIGGGKGLVVPVLRHAERMSFAEIEMAIADLAKKAKDNKLVPDDLLGGTFTITNGGIYGSMMSTPIVNPPQSGILGMHAIQERPMARNGEVVIRPMMYVALTYDHRLIDGREAVSFLVRIKECIENPTRMLIEV
ncbi:MAG: 2-oxoglutarate dehydrogenase complex dihydrolipoyllysine-residue succinyltransferase [Abitibacteriaceae bacterium]|nr:2-oxoglutarate dehydrogenase complex dihydrolipoyllysine-residue succinyltransferase [Abditibacteriaceae bacterium]